MSCNAFLLNYNAPVRFTERKENLKLQLKTVLNMP